MPIPQDTKDAAITRLLYDLSVLVDAIEFLKRWTRKPKTLDLGEERLALNAALVKTRLLYDFFYVCVGAPNDVTADKFLPVPLRQYTNEELAFRRLINTWCAHMSWKRVSSAAKTRPPTRPQARRFGSAVLSHAIPFVEAYLDDGYKPNKTARIYWLRIQVGRPDRPPNTEMSKRKNRDA